MIHISYLTILFQIIGFLFFTFILIPILGLIIYKNKFQFKKVLKFILIILCLIIISWPCILINNLIYNNKLKQKISKYIQSKDVYIYVTTIYAHSQISRSILLNEIQNNKYQLIKVNNYFNYMIIIDQNKQPENIKHFECFKLINKNQVLKIIFDNNIQELILK